jgi:poly(3-hydroxybutyrate) depolymerase
MSPNPARLGVTRRHLLATVAGSLIGVAGGRAWGAPQASAHFELQDIEVAGDPQIGRRFTLMVPKHVGTGRVPLLVLLHGLGETGNQRTGAHAWVERYGLGQVYDRLRSPPIRRIYASKGPAWRYWEAQRLAEVNALLTAQPFRGLAIACPFTPNVYRAKNRNQTLDAYASWLVDTVIPRARKDAKVMDDPAHTYLDGCSLGGYVGLEVFLRQPGHFGAWGSVQGALGAHRVKRYAERIAAVIRDHGKRPIHLETSTGDAFRKVNKQLSRELTKAGVAHDWMMPPGPHNQPFLRESGTLEMLLWHDRLPR